MSQGAWAPADRNVRRRNGRTILFTLGPYCAVGAFIALLPEDIATRLPLPSSVNYLVGVIPGVSRWAALASHPDVTRLFMSVMWLGLPFAAFAVGWLWVLPARIYEVSTFRKVMLFGTFLTGLALFIFFLAFPSDVLLTGGLRGARTQRLMAQTHVGLAIFGPLFFASLAIFIGVPLRFLCHTVTGRRDAT